MKKLALILAMLLVIPCSAFGLEMLNDSAMDEVTGQAGVSIALDDIQIFLNIERLAWIDCDGFSSTDGYGTCSGDAGAVGISNFQLDVLTLNAIVNTPTKANNVWDLASLDCGTIPLDFDYGNTSTAGTCSLSGAYTTGGASLGTQTLGLNNYRPDNTTGYFTPRALTIDATSELPAATAAKRNILHANPLYSGLGAGIDTIGFGGVLIGIPTIEIYIPSLSLTPAFYNVDGAAEAANDVDGSAIVPGGADYGTIQIDGITFTPLGGWLEIAPH